MAQLSACTGDHRQHRARVAAQQLFLERVASAGIVENLVALRLPGKWTLDQEISNRLDSARVTPAPKTVEFT